MHPSFRLLAASLILLLLAACASIPLGTLWRLRGFDVDTLVQLDPAELRAAVALQPDHPLEPDSVRLGLELSRRDGETDHYTFALVPTREPGPTKSGWNYSTWALDAPGRREFARMQQVLGAAGDDIKAVYSGATFSVEFNPNFGGSVPESLRMSAQLRLALAEGYFLLVDDAVIPVEGFRRAQEDEN
jgi:hypothetical protein